MPAPVLMLRIARCSITSFILATPMARTCVGCKRKAFLPPALRRATDADAMAVDGELEEDVGHLPDAARSWVVKELLRAVCKCLFCGNSFTSLL
jgi:general transcription factor 3C protein 4